MRRHSVDEIVVGTGGPDRSSRGGFPGPHNDFRPELPANAPRAPREAIMRRDDSLWAPAAAAAMAIVVLAAAPSRAALDPPEHPLFVEDAVHEIHLSFSQPDWWEQLVANFEGQEDPLYLPAAFDWNGVHLDSIGVRFKGNSSYHAYPGVKKSFKLDIDEYVEGQEIDGLDKLNLNNAFLDPSFVREKCCYELCASAGLPAERTNYAALTINGEYWGLYNLIEQVDQEFLDSRFGPGENGNLWKGDPHGTLEYFGSSEPLYYDSYELKTNEEENDWSALVDFVAALNLNPSGALIDSLHPRADVNSALAMIAVDNLTVNLDSYIGRGGNYYFYHRDRDSRMVFINWDVNEAWGVFNQWGMSVEQLKHLDIAWTSTHPGQDRPLAERLLAIEELREIYEGHFLKLMAGAAQPDTLLARMTELRDLIRPYVHQDTNMMFSNEQFEMALESDIIVGGGPNARIVPGLEPFIRERDAYLRGQLGSWSPVTDLALNELMADNAHTLADEYGDFDDWLEIVNRGAAAVALGDFSLTDHLDGTPVFSFPSMVLEPGEYLVVWTDGEELEGPLHASFRLDAGGEDLYLLNGGVIVEQLTFLALGEDQSYGRWPDATGGWELLSVATPGAPNENPVNPEEVVLFINEFLALNDSGLQDETGDFEDWLEIYNPGPDAVEMGGLYLTDDLAQTTQWAFPDTILAPGGYLIIWCDGDPEDGPLHANFKLSGDGEEVGLFGRLAAGNELIDSCVFGAQVPDISYGRETDGGEPWVFCDPPTPGATNEGGSSGPGDDPDTARAWVVNLYPNPFRGGSVTIELTRGMGALQSAAIYDLQGRRVRRLDVMDPAWSGNKLRLVWDARSDNGLPLSPGIYFLRVVHRQGELQRRVVCLR
ncbi:MAG: T9SS type A sorting domain-containing protein [Candidatus Eisenbacteria bacterium]|nr:T9SS type A sorting domain-containing protein [Candidatus Eisenbacteria bacterium]